MTYVCLNRSARSSMMRLVNKHDVHTAKNRTDGNSYLNHLMNLHSQFHDPTNQPLSYMVMQHDSLDQPDMPDFVVQRCQMDPWKAEESTAHALSSKGCWPV
ncbi:hypothetical protein ABBQ38_011003 [Trebouxia sp. C0009 RCD-2024]